MPVSAPMSLPVLLLFREFIVENRLPRHMAKSEPFHSAGEKPPAAEAEPDHWLRVRSSMRMLRAALSENSTSRRIFFGWWFSMTSTLLISCGEMFFVASA